MTPDQIVALLLAISFGAVRLAAACDLFVFTGHPFRFFEAFAHLFVGWILGVYAANRQTPYLVIAIAVSLAEVVAFFIGRGV